MRIVAVKSMEPKSKVQNFTRPSMGGNIGWWGSPGTKVVGVFRSPTSKFVIARLVRMVYSEDTRVYTGSSGISLRPVLGCSCYQHLFVVEVTKGREREKVPSL